MKRLLQLAGFGACVLFSVAAVHSVVSDNGEVERLAREAACGGAAARCDAAMRRLSRSPFGQSMDFAVGSTTVTVSCKRSYVLAGDYACSAR